MNQKISICILVLLIVITATTITAVVISNNSKEPNEIRVEQESTVVEPLNNENFVETVKDINENKYLLKSVNGKIIVFANNGEDIYFETDLRDMDLPLALREQIKEGIYLKNDKELYDFLESYSS